jgi:CBS domain-containing protein
MVESGVGRIPIVEVGTNRVVGILSRHDLLKVRSARKRAEIDRT